MRSFRIKKKIGSLHYTLYYAYEAAMNEQRLVLHRENGPASIREDDRLEWRRNGIHIRKNGPSMIIPCIDEIIYLYTDKKGKIIKEERKKKF